MIFALTSGIVFYLYLDDSFSSFNGLFKSNSEIFILLSKLLLPFKFQNVKYIMYFNDVLPAFIKTFQIKLNLYNILYTYVKR